MLYSIVPEHALNNLCHCFPIKFRAIPLCKTTQFAKERAALLPFQRWLFAKHDRGYHGGKIRIHQKANFNYRFQSSVPARGATSSSFRGWQFSWTFFRWRHRAYSTVVQLFRKQSQTKFSSKHFRKWKLSFNQACN